MGKPATAFDVSEIVGSRTRHQLPLWACQLGFTDDAEALVNGRPRQVNPSGGTLAGTPQTTSGLARAAEAALQLRGEAGARQIKGARRALAHGTTGPAGQQHTVIVLET